MWLEGQHVVVVGGSSGIGLGVARSALACGASVTLAARSPERLARARQSLDGGERARAVAADITREEDVVALLREVEALDHLVVTAVDAAYHPIERFEVEDVRRVIDSKLVGPLLLAKHARARIRPGGSITLTSGIAAHRPSRSGGAVVAAVNGALEALARALAVELGPIRVNVVSPGWVDTPIWDALAGENKGDVLRAMADRLPVHRIGAPDDTALAYLFLMRSAHTTGAVVHVDGGQRLV